LSVWIHLAGIIVLLMSGVAFSMSESGSESRLTNDHCMGRKKCDQGWGTSTGKWGAQDAIADASSGASNTEI
jgi:hypothetical protein